jgi:nitroreductase
MLAELPEDQARGCAREIYEEIRRLSGVPMVALIYRHLATIPGALEWAWTLLRPVMTDGVLQERAWRLPARAGVQLEATIGREVLRDAGISAEDETEIAAVLDAYNRANPVNIVAVRCLALHLAGSVATVGGSSSGQPSQRAWAPPSTPRSLPAMLDAKGMDPETRELVRLLTDRGTTPSATLVPSLYRHLARWPGMIRLAAEIVTPQFAVIDTAAGHLRDEVERATQELAAQMIPPSDLEPPTGVDRRRLHAALESFTHRIPEMVVIGHLLRRALPDQGNPSARRSLDPTGSEGSSVAAPPGAGLLSADEALRTRRSIRAFLPDPVPRETVEELLALASRSASGSNIQPWKVHVVAGEVRATLSRTILDAIERDGYEKYRREWNYYPVNWREPYLNRRRKIGWGLYGLLGIGKGDFEGTERQRRRNYNFFGAPVGMIFTLDDDLEIGSWLDLGIYIGSLTIAARGRGLHTCPQAAFADFHSLIRPLLGVPDKEIIICGLALGYADPDAVENQLVTERASLADFATFTGF